MAWIADLAGKAESLLNNLDEQTGAAIRNHNVSRQKKRDFSPPKKPMVNNNRFVKSRNAPPSRSCSPVRDYTSFNEFVMGKTSGVNSLSIKPRAPQNKSNFCNINPTNNTKKAIMQDICAGMGEKVAKHRRNSLPLPQDLTNMKDGKVVSSKLHNLEVENCMLRNELNVINLEVSELVGKLRKTEDGKALVNGSEELEQTNTLLKMKNHIPNDFSFNDKDSIEAQLSELKVLIYELTNVEMNKYRDWNKNLEGEVGLLKQKNSQLENKLKDFGEKVHRTESQHHKLENELRHANTVIAELDSNLERSRNECKRLEQDWEAYKVRVKGMLHAKDNEIRSLQEGLNMNEDCKVMMQQVQSLKEERDELSETIERVRVECNDMRHYIEQIEKKNTGIDRVVTALREALKDERLARNKAEAQYLSVSKELKVIKLEKEQMISTLRNALQEKELEMDSLRGTASSVKTFDTSALNVADYERNRTEAVESEKVKYLSEILVHRQTKIDSLLADNNMLKIQVDKLQSKLNAIEKQSVINFQDGDSHRVRSRTHVSNSLISQISVRIAVLLKRNPIFRVFILLYMVCLHLWVITVLLTSTPDGFSIPRANRA